MKNSSKLVISIIAALFLFAGSAQAHVTVQPSTSGPEAWETYTLKVPVEKETATTKVALKVPEGATFSSYQPLPNWKVTTQKDQKGRVKTITWEATGDGIESGQFQQFTFVAQNPNKETRLAWDAFQYYADGEIVEWSGDEGSDLPHSVTEITATAKGSQDPAVHEHDSGRDHKHPTSTDKQEESIGKDTDSHTLYIVLSVLSLIISLLALIVAIRKNKK